MYLKKNILYVAIIVFVVFVVFAGKAVLTWKQLNQIDFIINTAIANINPELKSMHSLTNLQCGQVYAGIYILSMVSLDDTKKILKLNDNNNRAINKIELEKFKIRVGLFYTNKKNINKLFGTNTISEEIVYLVKRPSYDLYFEDEYKSIADKLITQFKKVEDLLKAEIKGGNNYNIVETIIAAMPKIFSSFLESY